MAIGEKYAPLGNWLKEHGGDFVKLTFDELNQIIPIPTHAYKNRPSWANLSNPASFCSSWISAGYVVDCNGVQREHNKKLNNGLPILHKVPPKRDYGRYFCIMAEKGGTSHGGLTEKLSPFFHAKKQEVNAYGR